MTTTVPSGLTRRPLPAALWVACCCRVDAVHEPRFGHAVRRRRSQERRVRPRNVRARRLGRSHVQLRSAGGQADPHLLADDRLVSRVRRDGVRRTILVSRGRRRHLPVDLSHRASDVFKTGRRVGWCDARQLPDVRRRRPRINARFDADFSDDVVAVPVRSCDRETLA